MEITMTLGFFQYCFLSHAESFLDSQNTFSFWFELFIVDIEQFRCHRNLLFRWQSAVGDSEQPKSVH